ncbi:hypothetical protein O6H91_01G099800 [Diphasiastrum complanatum]|uniref:Uncharacterized protein n=1 Tax=Diphasiastrum complanatum TaxID=34168 RepID=A0ACC2EU07_DIPCM|nr:hypothetical protein O6H91_01G099800 [Diphasiastrum complanatum]
MENADGLLCTEKMFGSPWGDEETVGYSSDEESNDNPHLFPDFPIFDDVDLACLFEKELSHMPGVNYPNMLLSENVSVARSNAVQWIIKVCCKYKFRPLTVALAVNYFDRYLSKNLTKSWKAWMIQLLSVACVSLGAKMEEINVPIFIDLQVEGLEHSFQPRTVQRMELAVLSALKWRMSSVTVFSYLDDLLQRLSLSRCLHKSILIRVTELVFGTYSEADFLEFRPSCIALMTLRCALEELAPLQAEAYTDALIKILPVEVNIDRCYRLLEELVADPVGPLQSSSQVFGSSKPPLSPVTVAEIVLTGNDSLEAARDDYTSSCMKRPGLCQNVLGSLCSKSRKRKLDSTLK